MGIVQSQARVKTHEVDVNLFELKDLPFDILKSVRLMVPSHLRHLQKVFSQNHFNLEQGHQCASMDSK